MWWPHKCKWEVAKQEETVCEIHSAFYPSREVSGYMFLKKCSKCGKEKAEFSTGSKTYGMDVAYIKASHGW